MIGPCGSPWGAGAPNTPAVPGAIGRVEGTGASQPWFSAISFVQGLGGGGAFEQRSTAYSSAQTVRATHLLWKSSWKAAVTSCWRAETRVWRICSRTSSSGVVSAGTVFSTRIT